MGFGAVGAIMLIIVFIFYMRMVDARMKTRQGKDQIKLILDKVAIFESVAKDDDALNLINTSLEEYPDNPTLVAKKEYILNKINET